MLYETKLIHPTRRNEVILVKWTKGFMHTELWHRDRKLCEIEGIKVLRAKFIVHDDEFGKVEVFLVGNPMKVNIKLNGIHSPDNENYPLRSIKRISFWLIPGLIIHSVGTAVLLYKIFDSAYYATDDIPLMIYHIIFLIAFLVSFILIRLNYPLYFFLGMGAYLVQAAVLLFNVLQQTNGDIAMMWRVNLVYDLYCVLLILPVFRLIVYLRHKPFVFEKTPTVLDD